MSKKSIFLIIFLFTIYFVFNSFSYSYSVSKQLSENIFRIHIIANSDSEEDQNLKLYIRDKIIQYLNQFKFNNKQEMISFLNENSKDIENIIENSIKEKGFFYEYSMEIGNSYFPKRNYSNITLPAGFYDGIKVRIGKAEGKNWWCILFPPMCLIDSTTCELKENSQKILEESLNNETYSLISSESPKYEFKFKILEFINNL